MVRPFYIGHGYSIYDVLVKIPLVFKGKDNIPHGLSSVQVRQIDIFPTILDILNIPIENKRSGKSLLPIINGVETNHRDAYLEAVGIVIPNKEDWLAGMRIDNEYKYIYSSFRRDYKEELYLLVKDPFERNNVAKEYPKLIKTLKSKIENLRTKEFLGERLNETDQKKVIDRLRALGYID